MAEQSSTDWKQRLEQAVRQAKADVIGANKIKEVHHAFLVTTALRAFGDDPRATFYIEGLPPTGNIPRPDLILLHPMIGVLVIENKGIKLSDIHAVQNTELTILRDGRLKPEDPFAQADRVMFRLRDLVGSRVDLYQALFLYTAALPRIERNDFERRFDTRWPDQTLFADCCSDPDKFKSHILGFSDFSQRAAKRSTKLSKRAHDAAILVLSGKSFLYAPRHSYLEDADPSLLGVQIQELELAIKDATDQQKEHGRADFRGSHRLFRGVAGSGKSVLLALSIAQTLLKLREEEQDLFSESRSRKRVLVVCFNKTLVQYLRQRIDDRFGRVAWDKPDRQSLTVVHFDALVWQLVNEAPALDSKLTFKERPERAKRMAAAFNALDQKTKDTLLFDAVYIDEAQDLGPEEIQLLLRLARKDEKGAQTFVVFYDNAQNIYGVPTPVWQEIGLNVPGRRTVFLDSCLRNTREILGLAFNVLVGSFALAGQRVTTRTFADVGSLRDRKLITEKDDRFEIHFAPRGGPTPQIAVYSNRQEEVDGTVGEVRRLVREQRVLPSDILILYGSHKPYKDSLPFKLQAAIGNDHQVRLVDRDHEMNKNLPLIEDGFLTCSTIHSAKGYDAAVVFLLGVDDLGTTTEDRATFYVAATRAKLLLAVSGLKRSDRSLFDEIIATADALKSRSGKPEYNDRQTEAAAPTEAIITSELKGKSRCRFCQSERQHAQHGKFGYFFRCIDCTKNTPIDAKCPMCGEKGRIRKAGDDFYRECGQCKRSEVFHTNVPLTSM